MYILFIVIDIFIYKIVKYQNLIYFCRLLFF